MSKAVRNAAVMASRCVTIGCIVRPSRVFQSFAGRRRSPTAARPAWWNGRHRGFKNPGPKGRAGSSPAAGTNSDAAPRKDVVCEVKDGTNSSGVVDHRVASPEIEKGRNRQQVPRPVRII